MFISLGLPFLKTGVTQASFQSSGKIPVDIAQLKMLVIEFVICGADIFINWVEMPSRPVANSF